MTLYNIFCSAKRPGVLWVYLVSMFLFAELPLGVLAKDFHVATGASGGDGSEFKPFATLTAAVAESRVSPGPHRILIQGGSYYDVTVQLGAQDSGLVIENAPGQSATLYGGVPLSGWQAEGKFQVAPLPPAPPNRRWEIRLLLINDESRPRARYPATGTLTHETAFNVPWMSTTGGGWQRRPTVEELTTLNYKAGDLGAWLEITNAEITVFHMWDESCVGIAAIDTNSRTLKLAPASGHPPGAFGVKKYVLWNIKEGLTEPGQWYHDRARNRIVYWPKPGEDMAKLHVVVPTQTSILSLRGSRDEPIKDITVRGLTFAGTTVPLIAGGFAAAAFDGAISLGNAEGCVLDHLVIKGVAGHAIKGGRSIKNARVENCTITDCGAGGVYVGGSKAVIRNNHIWKIGRSYPSAIGIYEGGRECLVSHNEVHDCSYSAINYGGTGNIVESNLLYDCMKVLHDGAAIYMFAATNCILRGNLARDFSDTGGYGASAYYLDERSSRCVVENNVSLRVNWPSHNHMATNNIIRNNLFIVDGDAKITFPRSTDYTLERNVLYATGKIRFEGFNAVTNWSNNLFYSGKDRIECVTLSQYSAQGTASNPPPNSVVADPLFVDLAKGDFRYRPDSPALKLGIQPIDISRVEIQTLNWPAPAGEALFEDYQLTVGGVEVPVYACRVSAVPFNQVWPGYQRPLDQTEMAGFAYWDMCGPVNLEIRCPRAPGSVVVRPQSLGIKAVVAGERIRFTLERPRPIVVEVDGSHHALHLFASPPELDVPQPDAPGVRYFGPGVHRPGKIELQNNQIVYLAGGAVVYGCISGQGVSKVRIRGRGILDGSQFERGQGGGAVRLRDCSDIVIEGIVMRDPDVWCCSLFGCRHATIQNVKLIGLWRYNADGIDICNSENITVRDCFVRSYDDSLVVKGLKWNGNDSYHERPARNIRFSGCVLWNDWGRAAEIGAETSAPEISGIVFEDCDVIHNTHIALDIQHGDRATVRDIRFQDIRVEVDQNNPRPRMQVKPGEIYTPGAPDYYPELLVIVIQKNFYSQDDQRGTIRDVLLKNITVTGSRMLQSWMRGLDVEHDVSGVSIENLRFNGERLETAQDAHLRLENHVHDVRFGN
jgi:hypothetical protein